MPHPDEPPGMSSALRKAERPIGRALVEAFAVTAATGVTYFAGRVAVDAYLASLLIPRSMDAGLPFHQYLIVGFLITLPVALLLGASLWGAARSPGRRMGAVLGNLIPLLAAFALLMPALTGLRFPAQLSVPGGRWAFGLAAGVLLVVVVVLTAKEVSVGLAALKGSPIGVVTLASTFLVVLTAVAAGEGQWAVRSALDPGGQEDYATFFLKANRSNLDEQNLEIVHYANGYYYVIWHGHRCWTMEDEVKVWRNQCLNVIPEREVEHLIFMRGPAAPEDNVSVGNAPL